MCNCESLCCSNDKYACTHAHTHANVYEKKFAFTIDKSTRILYANRFKLTSSDFRHLLLWFGLLLQLVKCEKKNFHCPIEIELVLSFRKSIIEQDESIRTEFSVRVNECLCVPVEKELSENICSNTNVIEYVVGTYIFMWSQQLNFVSLKNAKRKETTNDVNHHVQ